MITKSQFLDAIATAILNNQSLYIDTFDTSAVTTDDFYYCSPYESPAGHDLLFSADEFIATAIEGERTCHVFIDDVIRSADIKHGWNGEADMPTWEQIREYVSCCDDNDNFAYTIACLKSEGFMED